MNYKNEFGSKNLCSIYGGGCNISPKFCFVFINPTARNIATQKSWNGIKTPWLETKQV